ncbi:MAG: GspE/PulE family protein [Patescibacteria group bacterium]
MVDINNTISFLTREQEERHTKETAAKLKLPYMNLVNYPIVKEVLEVIPEEDAIAYQVAPFLKVGHQIRIGMVDPTNEKSKAYLSKIAEEKNVSFAVSLVSKTSFIFGVYAYEQIKTKAIETKAEEEKRKEDNSFYNIKDIKGAAEAAKTATITRLLETILFGAINLGASDVHLEPAENKFLVRLRIDGVLQDLVDLPLQKYKQLLQRIKYVAKLRMDITDKPQDGHFSLASPDNKSLDFRVSTMPSASGEAVVLRLLNMEGDFLKLENMGFRPDALVAIREAIGRPHGMVITSGPTGSGKTTTLYALLLEIKKPGVKIITLEDPVEFKMEGIEQSQIKPGQGYEFADGLRGSMRQDPNVLMVGEIRDLETAEIAIQAALTGHLMLSTIHANSAPAVYARFLEMGVKPFLLTGSLNIIMAQRLVRRICKDCATQYEASDKDWKAIVDILSPIVERLDPAIAVKLENGQRTLFQAKGCSVCSSTGYVGRVAVVEYIVPNDTIEGLVTSGASISMFDKEARKEGMITMEQDGLIKALAGITTLDEVWRVTRS